MKKKLVSLLLVICLFVSLLPVTAFAMQLTVEISMEEPIVLEVDVITTIESVKSQIQDKTGIPAAQQILLYQGKELAVPHTLADYNVPSEDITIQLVIRQSETEDEVTVTFDSQGGTAVENQTVTVNSKIEKPADPTRTGYTFVGWFQESGCENQWDFDTDMVTENTTLYAKWTAVPSGGTTWIPSDIPDEPHTWENPFTDVKEDDWYYEAVQFTNESGLLFGIGEKAFAPEISTTRGMLATVIHRLAKEPEAHEDNPFSDVELGKYYTVAIAWAAENEVVYGYGNGKYGPDDLITREQLAAILWRYAGRPESSGSLDNFTDGNKASNYAVPALRWAVEQKIVNGKDGGILDPRGKATRAEAAAMLMRYCEKG